MLIELDLRSHVPIYSQIVNQVRQLVAAGVLKPEEQLPTVRQLAADLRVNFNTVARAYRMLDQAGVISTQQGRGTYVLEPRPEESPESVRETVLHELALGFFHEAHRLGFEHQEVADTTSALLDRWRQDREPPQAEDESS